MDFMDAHMDFIYQGMECLRYFSVTNPWIDFFVIVPSDWKDEATSEIGKAMDDFWDDDSGRCYGDLVHEYLDKKDIPYLSIFYDANSESEEYDEQWVALIKKLEANQAISAILLDFHSAKISWGKIDDAKEETKNEAV